MRCERALALVAVIALVSALPAGRGEPAPQEYDFQGMTKEQRAFARGLEEEGRLRQEEWIRNSPRAQAADAPLLRASTAELRRTVVAPHPGVPISGEQNLLWCATWQLAWDVMCTDVVGGPLHLGPPAPAAFDDAMNLRAFPRDALDAGSFLVRAGPAETVIPGLRAELKERFGVEMLPLPSVLGPSVVAYAYLRKSLPFEHRFLPRLGPLSIQGSKVLAFGADCGSSAPGLAAVLGQVTVVEESHPSGIILEIAVKGGRDRFILAMVPPEETLAATWERVRGRIDSARPRTLQPGAGLAIPKMNFLLEHRFREILGAEVLDGPTAGHQVLEASQTLRFSLDEGGAVLESHAVLDTGLGEVTDIVIDRPFLLALVQKGGKEPYLLAWIANDELLAKAR